MEALIILILWFLFCAGVGNLAKRKGHSGAFWFLLAVILSPLVGLVLMCFPDRNDNIERQMLQSGSSKKCPYCAEIIKVEARVCRFCGRDLISTSTAPGSSNRDFVAQQSSLATGQTYRISKDGMDFGELSKFEILELLRSNDLTPEDFYYEMASKSWVPIKNNPVFAT